MSFRRSKNAQLGAPLPTHVPRPLRRARRGRPGPGPRARVADSRASCPSHRAGPPGWAIWEAILSSLPLGRELSSPGPETDRSKVGRTSRTLPSGPGSGAFQPRGPKFPGSELRPGPHSHHLNWGGPAGRGGERSLHRAEPWAQSGRMPGGSPGVAPVLH